MPRVKWQFGINVHYYGLTSSETPGKYRMMYSKQPSIRSFVIRALKQISQPAPSPRYSQVGRGKLSPTVYHDRCDEHTYAQEGGTTTQWTHSNPRKPKMSPEKNSESRAFVRSNPERLRTQRVWQLNARMPNPSLTEI